MLLVNVKKKTKKVKAKCYNVSKKTLFEPKEKPNIKNRLVDLE